MRVVLRSSSLLFSLVGIAVNAPLHKVRPILRRGSADGMRVGMPLDDLMAEFGARLKFDEKTGRADLFLVSELQHRPDISFEIAAGAVGAIRVYSRRYKTETGVGVGDQTATLAARYPVRWIEDNLAGVDDLNMKFEIRDEQIASIIIS